MSTANSRRTALITGASRGLGAAIALELGAMGVNAAVNYFNSGQAAEQLCQRIQQAGGHAHAFKADVRSETEGTRLSNEIAQALAKIHVFVVSATGAQQLLS